MTQVIAWIIIKGTNDSDNDDDDEKDEEEPTTIWIDYIKACMIWSIMVYLSTAENLRPFFDLSNS